MGSITKTVFESSSTTKTTKTITAIKQSKVATNYPSNQAVITAKSTDKIDTTTGAIHTKNGAKGRLQSKTSNHTSQTTTSI